MNGSTRCFVALLCAIAVAGPAAVGWSQEPAGALTDRQKIVHALNRLGYGPRPGDVERVEKMGLDRYIRQQLEPQSIDDSAVDAALAPLDTLKMSSAHLMDEYMGDIRRYIEQQEKYGDPAEMKLRYGVDLPRSKEAGRTPPPPQKIDLDELVKRDALRCVGELQKAKLIRAVMSERQLNEVLVDFWENHFNIDIKKNQCRALQIADDRDAIRPHVLGKFRDLLGASAHSPAMLAYLDNNENSVVRERGKFEQAMIGFYVRSKFGIDPKNAINMREGPNENYGREILELHTLGVDGGYTQKDVQEVARCFTGWMINPFTSKFQFNADRHDNGQKLVLGHVIPADGGVKDGEAVLDLLAAHPSTAHFISRKLCQRFVADDPPAELVDRVAQVFLHTDGDLRQVVEAILTSPEFLSPAAYRAKIKSPLEYVVSAVRATSGRFVSSPYEKLNKVRAVAEGAGTLGFGNEKLSAEKRKTLNWQLHDMGMPLFDCAPPTGYPEVSSKWVSPGALIDRLNFALALTSQDISDVRIDPAGLLDGADADQPERVFGKLSEALLHGEVNEKTRQTIMSAAGSGDDTKTVDVAKMTALLLGSPDFQRR